MKRRKIQQQIAVEYGYNNYDELIDASISGELGISETEIKEEIEQRIGELNGLVVNW